MIALAHRALDCAVNIVLRVLSRFRRACRLAAPSIAGSSGWGRLMATRSALRSLPRCSATISSTRESSGVICIRVVIATPDGPATGFTPRHSRNRTAVTKLIIRHSYDNFGSPTIGRQSR